MKKTIISAILLGVLVAVCMYRPTIELGVSLDNEGNGIVVKANGEPIDPLYNYISFKKGDKGDKFATFYLYRPMGGEDDIIFRQDFLLSKKNEVEQYEPYTNRLYFSNATFILEDGNIYDASILTDSNGTETPIDDMPISVGYNAVERR